MKVFVITSQKGGVGKTSLSGHIGVELAARNKLVVLVDTDPHAGLTDWWNDRAAEEPQLLSVEFGALAASLELLREANVDFVIIDTPPQVSQGIQDLVDLADLVIIPSKASRHDLRATRKTVDLVEGSNRSMVFVLNEVRPRTRIEGEAILALAQHGKLAPIVHYRQDIVTGMIDGRTIQEISPGSPGALEISVLCDYLLKQVGIEVPKQVSTKLSKYPTGDRK
jgi:chromosome partitioning protein